MIAFLRQLIVWIVAVTLLGQGVGLSQRAQAIPLQLGSSTSTTAISDSIYYNRTPYNLRGVYEALLCRPAAKNY
jgi:hypothetical protein